MRLARAAVIAAVSIATASAVAVPSHADDWVRCRNPAINPDLRIGGCTAIIQSGRETSKLLVAAYDERAAAFASKGDDGRAIQDFDHAIELVPNDASAYDNRGSFYKINYEYDRAIRDFDQAIKLLPDDIPAYTNRGAAYNAKGEYDRAIQDFDQAIQYWSRFAGSLASDETLAADYNNRGAAYKGKGEYDRAIQDFDQAIRFASQAIRLAPNQAAPYALRGTAYDAKGEHDRAIQDFDQAIRLAPNNAAAYTNRGAAYNAKGEYDRAIHDFDLAIKLDAHLVSAYNNRGVAYKGKSEYYRAMQDFNQAIRLAPDDAAGYANRGVIKFILVHFDDAAVDLEKSLSFAPSDAYAVLWLHLARRRLGQDDAQEFAARMTGSYPSGWPATVAKLYLGQATPDQVLAAASSPDAKVEQDQRCKAAFYLGEYLILQLNIDEAMRRFQGVRANCDKGFIEYDGAVAELTLLKL